MFMVITGNPLPATSRGLSKQSFRSEIKNAPTVGAIAGTVEFSIDYDMRVVFSFVDPNKVLFVDIRTHDEVY